MCFPLELQFLLDHYLIFYKIEGQISWESLRHTQIVYINKIHKKTIRLAIFIWVINFNMPEEFMLVGIKISEPAIAAMYGPHSVFDIGHCTVIHCYAGGVSLVDR